MVLLIGLLIPLLRQYREHLHLNGVNITREPPHDDGTASDDNA